MVFSNKSLKFTIAILIACLPLFGFANNPQDSIKSHTETPHVTSEANHAATSESAHEGHGEPLTLAQKIDAYKNHHLLDAHDFTFFSDEKTGKHYGFPLPVILWDNGLQFFSSSKFDHGRAVAESNGNYYKLGHDEKIYKTDAAGTLTGDAHHPTNIKPIDFSITKSVLTMLVVSLIMFLIFAGLAKSFSKNGGISAGFGRIFEPLVLYIRDEIAIPNIGEKHYKRYMSYLLTIFFFVWFLNIFGLTPLGINVTGNIAITAGLAIITAIITNFTENKN